MIRTYRHGFLILTVVFALAACSAESSDGPVPIPVAEKDLEATSPVPPDPTVSGGTADRDRPPFTDPAPKTPRKVVIPVGTSIDVVLLDSVGTEHSTAGDVFRASLASALILDELVIVEQGARIQGVVVAAESSGRVSGRARIEVMLTALIADGRSIDIETVPLVQEAERDVGRDARIGAAGAAVGAVIGGLTGGKKASVIAGVAGGAGAVIATKGQQLSYPSESRLSFTLGQDLEIERPKTR